MTPHNIAYLSALVSVSEEVRSRCHVRHHRDSHTASTENIAADNFAVEIHLRMISINAGSRGMEAEHSAAIRDSTQVKYLQIISYSLYSIMSKIIIQAFKRRLIC